MFVKDYMTRHPIMVAANTHVAEAQRIMVENHIRHIPVVGDGKRLLGLITRQRLSISPERLGSLDVWEITRYVANLTVGQVMLTGPDLQTIGPEATLEEAAELLIRHKISGLPVVDEGIVVGILTETDLLVEMMNLLGAIDTGFRVVMRVPDRYGEFSKLTRAMAERGWGIMAMGSVRTPRMPDRWDIILKVRHATYDELMAVLKSIPDQDIVDVRETRAYVTRAEPDGVVS
jgi:acetoin utilization protein AcuB